MDYAGLESYILFPVDLPVVSQSHDLRASTARVVEEIDHPDIPGKPKVQPLILLKIDLNLGSQILVTSYLPASLPA